MGVINVFNLFRTYLVQLNLRQKSAQQIADIQESNFRALLKYAVSHSSFYRELYRGINVGTCSITDLPTVSRYEMLNYFDRVVTDPQLKQVEIEAWMNDSSPRGSLFKQHYVPMKTSGSSGQKLLVVYDLKGLNAIHTSLLTRLSVPLLTNLRAILGGLIGQPLKIATLVMTGGRYPAVSAAEYNTGTHNLFVRHRVINSDQSMANIVKELNKFQPDILYTYAGVLEMLAQEQIENRLRLRFQGSISAVLSMSELLTPRAKKMAEQAWNLTVDDTYAAAECLVMGRTCEQKTMHLMSDACILEAVDENNNVLPEGELGEKILITNLNNYVQPFIRYELKDITGVSSSRCACGSPFPVLLPIQGRSSDSLLVRNKKGVVKEVKSNIFIAELYKLDCLKDYQIHQTEINLVICYYVPVSQIRQDCRLALSQAFDTAMHTAGIEESEMSYKLEQVESIPRHKVSGKRQLIVGLNSKPGDATSRFKN